MNTADSIRAEIAPATLRRSANRRRKALLVAGHKTYYIRGYLDKPPAIVCLCCDLTSNNPGDVSNRYCAFCHKFHNQEQDLSTLSTWSTSSTPEQKS